MKNTYIKNDFGELRNLYWLALNGIIKQPFPPESFKWTWIYCTEKGEMQQAPFRCFTKGKDELTIFDFK